MSTENYPVSMIPYSEKAVNELIGELLMRPIVSQNRYINVGAAFDTETTSFIDEQSKKESALCYIWMFGIGKTVIYSRTLDDFVTCINSIADWLEENKAKLIIYVHFLKFDFSFIKRLFNWKKVFAKQNRYPLYAEYRNIEFRDSLALSGGRSLKKIGDNLRVPVHKAVGDLDYELIRHNETPLTDKELHYCEMDIRVLIEYINEKIEDENGINNIPYTNTGYVRRYVRNECFKDRERYQTFIDGLTMTPDMYLQTERAFMGGAVGPNIAYVGKTVPNVHSYDIKSSYPYFMITGYYPISMFTPVSDSEPLNVKRSYMDSHCCIFTLEAWDIEPIQDFCFPISYHKCYESLGVEKASGRIITADYIKINCTELDFKTWEKFYNLSDSNIRITRMRIAKRGRLPYPIVKSVVNFFNKKTTLDGVAGQESEYMISKNMLNSIYGAMVEKPVRPVFGYVNSADFAKEEPDFVEQVDAYNNKWNRFLYYPWGVYVTANARYRLYDAIYNIGNDFVYCDTDSVKFIGDHTAYFDGVNAIARNNIKQTAAFYNIPISEIVPKSPDGIGKWLGVWEHEYDAPMFKTIGAKRYLYLTTDGKYHLTAAGTNKKSTLDYIIKKAFETNSTPFDVFDDKLIVPAEYAKRTVSTYIDREQTGWITDYMGNRFYYRSPSGVHVAASDYSFNVTDEMKQACEYLNHESAWEDGQYE